MVSFSLLSLSPERPLNVSILLFSSSSGNDIDTCVGVARYAFHYASESGRNKVTAVHKANIMLVSSFSSKKSNEQADRILTCRKMSDGMFLTACRDVAKEYPNISYDEDLLDRVCLRVTEKLWMN